MLKELQELKNLLEGQTVHLVLEPDAPEAVCKFVLQNGKSFRLHATDLGFWIEETGNNGKYLSIDSLLTDYGHYVDKLFNKRLELVTTEVSFDKNELIITAPDGKNFIGDISSFSEKDKKILSHPQIKEILTDAAPFGYVWRVAAPKEILDA